MIFLANDVPLLAQVQSWPQAIACIALCIAAAFIAWCLTR